MKTNIKALKLVEKGLSSNTVSKLTESQINVLYSKLLGEQVTNPNVAVQIKNIEALDQKLTGLEAKMTKLGLAEKEIDEDADLDDSAEKESGYNPYAGNSDGNDDGPGEYGNNPDKDKKMDNSDADGMGMFEEKDGEPNPYYICHAQVGPKKSRKFERCVMSVKKQLKEGKNPVSLFLESQIEKIVERNMPPKITKGDLIKYIVEASPAPAPTTKPAPTKPGTKPGKRPNPFKNPNPGENPAPKAKKVSPEDAKEKVIDVIMQLLEK
jgi:hypothetical protein